MNKEHLKELVNGPSRIRFMGPVIEAGETNFDSLLSRAQEVYKAHPGLPRSTSYIKASLKSLLKYLA